jgi:phytoene synthase
VLDCRQHRHLADRAAARQMSRDTSFYYSFLVLPPGKRKAIIAVWDFCRAVDDAVDEVVPEEQWAGGLTEDARGRAAAQLSLWRSELAACYTDSSCPGHTPPRTAQARALRPLVTEFNLPREQLELLIDGVAMDLECQRYATFAALEEYCRRVASSVGLVCLEIFGYQDQRSRSYAVNLGLALQLTNIIRDVAVDLRRGRVYLPLEDLQRFDVTDEDLRRGEMTPAVRDLLQFECGRARSYYTRAAADLPRRDARSLVAAEIMGGIYLAILRRIERAGYDVFSRRIRVPRPRRAVIALSIWVRTLLGL